MALKDLRPGTPAPSGQGFSLWDDLETPGSAPAPAPQKAKFSLWDDLETPGSAPAPAPQKAKFSLWDEPPVAASAPPAYSPIDVETARLNRQNVDYLASTSIPQPSYSPIDVETARLNRQNVDYLASLPAMPAARQGLARQPSQTGLPPLEIPEAASRAPAPPPPPKPAPAIPTVFTGGYRAPQQAEPVDQETQRLLRQSRQVEQQQALDAIRQRPITIEDLVNARIEPERVPEASAIDWQGVAKVAGTAGMPLATTAGRVLRGELAPEAGREELVRHVRQQRSTPSAVRSVRAGVGDLAYTIGSAGRLIGLEAPGKALQQTGRRIQQENVTPQYEGTGLASNWLEGLVSNWRDPDFYRSVVARSAPFAIPLVALSVLGGVGGAAFAGLTGLGAAGTFVIINLGRGVVPRVMEGLMEAGQTYEDALDTGRTDEEATRAAKGVWAKNMALAGPDAAEFALAFTGLPIPAQKALGGLLKARLGRAAVGIARVLGTAAMEAGEEAVQEVFQRQALNRPVSWDDAMQQAAAAGAVFGGGMAAAGQAFGRGAPATQTSAAPAVDVAGEFARAKPSMTPDDVEAAPVPSPEQPRGQEAFSLWDEPPAPQPVAPSSAAPAGPPTPVSPPPQAPPEVLRKARQHTATRLPEGGIVYSDGGGKIRRTFGVHSGGIVYGLKNLISTGAMWKPLSDADRAAYEAAIADEGLVGNYARVVRDLEQNAAVMIDQNRQRADEKYGPLVEAAKPAAPPGPSLARTGEAVPSVQEAPAPTAPAPSPLDRAQAIRDALPGIGENDVIRLQRDLAGESDEGFLRAVRGFAIKPEAATEPEPATVPKIATSSVPPSTSAKPAPAVVTPPEVSATPSEDGTPKQIRAYAERGRQYLRDKTGGITVALRELVTELGGDEFAAQGLVRRLQGDRQVFQRPVRRNEWMIMPGTVRQREAFRQHPDVWRVLVGQVYTAADEGQVDRLAAAVRKAVAATGPDAFTSQEAARALGARPGDLTDPEWWNAEGWNAEELSKLVRQYFGGESPAETAPGPQPETTPLRSAAALPMPLATGSAATARTERGTAVDTRYAVYDAGALTASHDRALRPNPAYPQELQPRDRARAASEAQVQRIVANLQPEFLGASPKASEGAPIIGPDAVVESGNGRVIALQRAYERNHPNAQQYRQWLLGHAEEFGLDRAAILNAPTPVLVRVRSGEMTSEQRVEFARQANEQTVAAMSATEQAQADARKITGDLMRLFQPSDDGQILTSGNRDFIRNFLDQVVGPAEQGRYLTGDGGLSQEGVNRIRNAVFALAYGDTTAIERLAEDPDSNVRNIANAMVVAAPRMAAIREGAVAGRLHPLDIGEDIGRAMAKLSSLRAEGTKVQDYLRQGNLFAGQDLSPLGRDILDVFDRFKSSGKKIAAVLQTYVDVVEAAGSPNQQDFFTKATPTKAELLQLVIAQVEGVRSDAQATLFESPGVGRQGTPAADGGSRPGEARRAPGAERGQGGSSEIRLGADPSDYQRVLDDRDAVRANWNQITLAADAKIPQSLAEAISRATAGWQMRRNQDGSATLSRPKGVEFRGPIAPYERGLLREGEDRDRAERLAREALGNIESAGDSVSSAGGALVPESGETRTRGVGITAELAQTGRVDLRGQVARTARDVAVIAQALRDPRMEVAHVLYMKGRQVVAHEAFSSRLPGVVTATSDQPARDFSLMKARMARLGADGYYLVHNHPTGNPRPSTQDIEGTVEYARAVSGLKAHVIIDSGTYAVLPGKAPRKAHIRDLPKNVRPNPDVLLMPKLPHPALGLPVDNFEQVAAIGKSLGQSERLVTLLYLDSEHNVRAIQQVPVGLFLRPTEMGNYIRGRAREFGAQIAAAYYGGSVDLADAGRALIREQYLLDLVRGSDSTLRDMDWGSIDRGKTLGLTAPRRVRFREGAEEETVGLDDFLRSRESARESLRRKTEQAEGGSGTERGGLLLGRGPATQKPGQHAFDNAEAEERYRAAKGVPATGAWQKVQEALGAFWRQFNRKWEHLPPGPRYAELSLKLTRLEKMRDIAGSQAAVYLRGITVELDPEKYDLFTRKVILDDLIEDVGKQRKATPEGEPFEPRIPFGFTEEDLARNHARITEAAAADPEVAQAIKDRKAAWQEIKERYTEAAKGGIGWEPPLDRDDYFRHQVLAYAGVQRAVKGPGQQMQAPLRRGFLKQRGGSSQDINTDYLQAEFEVMAQMIHDTEVFKVWQLVRKVDIADTLKAIAIERNEAAIMPFFAAMAERENQARATTAALGGGVAPEVTAEDMFRRTLHVKQAMAMGALGRLAADHALPTGGGRWEALIDDLAENWLANKAAKADEQEPIPLSAQTHRELMAYAGWLLREHGGEAGSDKVALLFKGIREKLGSQYVTWEDLIPEGYVAVQPREGNVLYQVWSIPERAAMAAQQQMLQQVGLKPEDVRKVLVMGGKRRQLVVPEEVALTLQEFGRPAKTYGVGDAVIQTIMRGWKQMVLSWPTKAVKYNLNNLTGDSDHAFLGNPSGFRRVPEAFRDLYNVLVQKQAPSAEMLEWMQRGGLQSNLQVAELGDINGLELFWNLGVKPKEGAAAKLAKPWQWYWRKVRMASDFRESILRYANYLDYLRQMEANEGRPSNFGASDRTEVMALSDRRDRAWKLSNDLLGAYDEVTQFGQFMRTRVAPFWSWQEINFRFYKGVLKNALQDSKLTEQVGRLAARQAGNLVLRSPLIAMRLGRFVLRASALTAMAAAWNMLMYPDEEKKLPEEIRRAPHIILGRNPDGSIRYYNKFGALGDFLGWFGVDRIPGYMHDYLNGRKSLQQVVREWAMAPINKLWGAIGGWVKNAFEFVAGRTTYPDVSEPGRIRDRWQYLARSLGLGNEYDNLAGKPSKGYWRGWGKALWNEVDPYDQAYRDVLDAKFAWLRQHGKAGDMGSYSDKSNALYYFKLAGRYGDKEAAQRYLAEYIRLGGTKDGLEHSLLALDPLYGMSDADKGAFVRWLPGEMRGKLEAARRYYRDVLLKQEVQAVKEAAPGAIRQVKESMQKR